MANLLAALCVALARLRVFLAALKCLAIAFLSIRATAVATGLVMRAALAVDHLPLTGALTYPILALLASVWAPAQPAAHLRVVTAARRQARLVVWIAAVGWTLAARPTGIRGSCHSRDDLGCDGRAGEGGDEHGAELFQQRAAGALAGEGLRERIERVLHDRASRATAATEP